MAGPHLATAVNVVNVGLCTCVMAEVQWGLPFLLIEAEIL